MSWLVCCQSRQCFWGDFILRPDAFCLLMQMGRSNIAAFRIVAHIVREFTLTLSIPALFRKYISSLPCLWLISST